MRYDPCQTKPIGRKLRTYVALVHLSCMLAISGCGPESGQSAGDSDDVHQAARGDNGLGGNGLGGNGLGGNGLGGNGLGGNGLGGNGLGGNGLGGNGLSGTNVFTGFGFNGTKFTALGIPNGQSTQNFGAHDWVNHWDTGAGYWGGTPYHACGGIETAGDSFLVRASLAQSTQSRFQRSGNNTVRFMLTVGSGDVDLYVRKNALPTLSAYDCRPYASGTSTEICDITLGPGDTAFVMTNAFLASTGVTLTVGNLNGSGCDDIIDRDARLDALSYMVQCMCPSSVSVTYSDTHDGTSRVMNGKYNLAPNWCQGTAGTVVSPEEESAVSSCLLALVNTQQTHVPISFRTYGGPNGSPAIAPSAGELNFTNTAAGRFWGNLFSREGCYGNGQAPGVPWYQCCSGASSSTGCVETSYWHSTQGSYNQHWVHGSDGVWFFDTQRYSCAINQWLYGVPGTITDANSFADALGRTCDFDGCGMTKHLGNCLSSGWGSGSNFDSSFPSAMDGAQYVTYKGLNLRPVSIYIGLFADYEVSQLNPAGFTYDANVYSTSGPASNDQYSYSRIASGTFALSQEVTCGIRRAGFSKCINQKKLVGLTPAQAIETIFQVTKSSDGYLKPTNYNEPFSIGIRYSNGQNVNAGLRVWTTTTPNTAVWGQVNGDSQGSIFQPTGDSDTYKTAYFYPVYQQNWNGVTQIKVWVAGQSGVAAPDLDSVFVTAGPPPGCNGKCVQ